MLNLIVQLYDSTINFIYIYLWGDGNQLDIFYHCYSWCNYYNLFICLFIYFVFFYISIYSTYYFRGTGFNFDVMNSLDTRDWLIRCHFKSFNLYLVTLTIWMQWISAKQIIIILVLLSWHMHIICFISCIIFVWIIDLSLMHMVASGRRWSSCGHNYSDRAQHGKKKEP